jgi:transmembrane protein 231
MSVYELFSHSDRFHYRANLFSLATCFLILCTALTFLPPFLFAYYAGGYWIKESRYSEQPRVNYSSKYILITQNSDTTKPFFSSSYASINSIFQNAFIPGTTTVSAIDNNNDGITDQFFITFQFSYGSGVQINSVDLWLIFQYELRARQSIIMETMLLINFIAPGIIDISNNPNISSAGELILEQRQPIQSSGSDTTYNTSIIDLDNLFQTSSLNLSTVLDEYFTRKYYTSYQSQNLKWTPGTISSSNILSINIMINIGSQSIRFIPGFWQEFKWGWIQYVSVLLPFIIVFNRIKEFVFRKQFVRTLVEIPYHRYKDK